MAGIQYHVHLDDNKLKLTDHGCGCCGGSEPATTKDLDGYIADLKEELQKAEALKANLEAEATTVEP